MVTDKYTTNPNGSNKSTESRELFNLEAESQVLGLILTDARLLEAIPDLRSTDFWQVPHQWTFEAIQNLKYRGDTIDPITVQAELTRLGHVGDGIDRYYATGLYNDAPSISSTEYVPVVKTLASGIREDARLRRAISLHERAANSANKRDRAGYLIALDELVQLTGESQQLGRLQLTPVDALANLPPLEWLVPNLVLAGALNVLYGPPGCGKSFIALTLALETAQDADVVYIAAEGFGGYPDRVAAWSGHIQQPGGRLFFIDQAVNLLDKAAVQQLISLVKGLQLRLLVIDTLARCLGPGDENSARDLGILIGSCQDIQRATGAAILIVHHTPRGEQGRPRGSSALDGAADNMVSVTMDDQVIRVESSKAKDYALAEPAYYQLVEVDARPGRRSCVVERADKVIQTNLDRLTVQQRKVLEVCNLSIYAETGVHHKDLLDVVPKVTLWRVLAKLKNLGFISQASGGEPYFITDSGRQKIQGSIGSPDPGVIGSISSTEVPGGSMELREKGSTPVPPPLKGGNQMEPSPKPQNEPKKVPRRFHGGSMEPTETEIKNWLQKDKMGNGPLSEPAEDRGDHDE